MSLQSPRSEAVTSPSTGAQEKEGKMFGYSCSWALAHPCPEICVPLVLVSINKSVPLVCEV